MSSFWFPRQGEKGSEAATSRGFLRQVIPVLSGKTPLNWGLPPWPAQGIAFLYLCTKGCTLYSCSNNWLARLSSVRFLNSPPDYFVKKTTIALRSISVSSDLNGHIQLWQISQFEIIPVLIALSSSDNRLFVFQPLAHHIHRSTYSSFYNSIWLLTYF